MPSTLTPLFTKSAYSLPDVVDFVQTRLRALEAKMKYMRPEHDGYKDDESMRKSLHGAFNSLQDWKRRGFAIVVTDKAFSDSGNLEQWLDSLRPGHSAVEATDIGTGRTRHLRACAPDGGLHLVNS